MNSCFGNTFRFRYWVNLLYDLHFISVFTFSRKLYLTWYKHDIPDEMLCESCQQAIRNYIVLGKISFLCFFMHDLKSNTTYCSLKILWGTLQNDAWAIHYMDHAKSKTSPMWPTYRGRRGSKHDLCCWLQLSWSQSWLEFRLRNISWWYYNY